LIARCWLRWGSAQPGTVAFWDALYRCRRRSCMAREFMSSLVTRGLTGVRMIVSDDYAGLKGARRSVVPAIPWQRCQFHLQQNVQAYVPQQAMKAQVASELRAIFQSSDEVSATALLNQFVAQRTCCNVRTKRSSAARVWQPYSPTSNRICV